MGVIKGQALNRRKRSQGMEQSSMIKLVIVNLQSLKQVAGSFAETKHHSVFHQQP